MQAKSSEDLCSDCQHRKGNFETGELFQLFVCVSYDFLEPSSVEGRNRKQKKELKNAKKEEIIQKVTALRNSNGGDLIVHLKGIPQANRRMALFNEWMDGSLNSIIEDGSPFTTEYFKAWHPIYNEYLVLRVTASRSVSTADFKTKMALDDSVIRPTSQNMDRLLFDKELRDTSYPYLLGIRDIEECRNIQFKSIPAKRDLQNLLDHLWGNLRLPEYITSFSKLPTGGSYYIGVAEVGHAGQSGISYIGIPLAKHQHLPFRRGIYDRVSREMRRFSSEERILTELDENFIQIEFYLQSQDNYVVEIAVSPINGCVFYDKMGPETYYMSTDGRMERLAFGEWLHLFESRRKSFQGTAKTHV